MPWKLFPCVALFCAACSFKADYKDGLYTCTDNVCQYGDVCYQGFCRDGDGGIPDAEIDAPPPAFDCADPGVLTGQTTGDTTGRQSNISAMCDGAIQNGPDEVYSVHVNVAAKLGLKVTSSVAVDAYVIAPCQMTPSTPVCLGGVIAKPNMATSVTVNGTGDYYIVVDSENPIVAGAYTITVTFRNRAVLE